LPSSGHWILIEYVRGTKKKQRQFSANDKKRKLDTTDRLVDHQQAPVCHQCTNTSPKHNSQTTSINNQQHQSTTTTTTTRSNKTHLLIAGISEFAGRGGTKRCALRRTAVIARPRLARARARALAERLFRRLTKIVEYIPVYGD
jgi:hypothetical protein